MAGIHLLSLSHVNPLILTASLAWAVDRRHPQVGGAWIKNHLEGLRGSADGNHTIVRELRWTRTRLNEKTEKQAYYSWTKTLGAMLYVLVNLHQHHWSSAHNRSVETWPEGCRDISFCTPPTGLSLVVSDGQSSPWSEAPYQSLGVICALYG